MKENNLTVRLATEADLGELLRVFEAARVFMRENGNPTQWGLNRPTREEILENLNGHCCYAVERPAETGGAFTPAGGDASGRAEAAGAEGKNAVQSVICGTFALKFGPDPMYAKIDGKWLSDEPYAAIHALASDGTARGIADLAIRFAEEHPSRFLSGQTAAADVPVRFLRIDTHRNNHPMQAIIRGNGFAYCGVVHMLIDGTERLAYEKPL